MKNKIIMLLILLSSCTTIQKTHHIKEIDNRFVYVRIIKTVTEDSGYWVFFRDRLGIYKTFQFEKPDSIYPGKIVKMSKIYKINRLL